jgi:hypothetical protein
VDANLITVLAGVLGSVSGASATIATTWISQKSQTVRERVKWESANGAMIALYLNVFVGIA